MPKIKREAIIMLKFAIDRFSSSYFEGSFFICFLPIQPKIPPAKIARMQAAKNQ